MPTDTEPLQAIQHRGDGDDKRQLYERIGPDLVCVREVCEDKDAVDMQDERVKRSLSQRDKDDPEWSCHPPAPSQHRISEGEPHCEIQQATDSKIGQAEEMLVQIGKTLP